MKKIISSLTKEQKREIKKAVSMIIDVGLDILLNKFLGE